MSQSYDPSKATSGFVLLTIDRCRLISSTGDPPDQQGTLSIVCVTLDGSSSPVPVPVPAPVPSSSNSSATAAAQTQFAPEDGNRDVWIVLRIGAFEFPVSPTQAILQSRAKASFTFVNAPPGERERESQRQRSLTLVVPRASDERMAHDQETLEALFAQYGMLQEIDRDEYGSDGDLKGRLVLVDENDGEYVGWLGNDISVTEDPNIDDGGKEPVVVEVSEDGKDLNVRPASDEEKSVLVTGAGYISRGIVGVGDIISIGLDKASSLFASKTKPNPQPTVLSERTQTNVKRMQTFSGQAVDVSSKTLSTIHGFIDDLAARAAGSSKTKDSDAKKKKPGLVSNILISADMILSAFEQSAQTVIQSGARNASAGVHHRYGPQAGDAARNVGSTAHNMTLVYIDARGVGRRALLKRVGKGYVKNKMGKGVKATTTANESSVAESAMPPAPALPPRQTPSPLPPASVEKGKGVPPSLPPR